MGRIYKMQQRTFFRTPVRIKIPAEFPDILFDELFQELSRIDQLLNSHIPGSFTDRINQAAGQFVEVDEETISLFRRVISWSEITGGAFDMTVTPLLRMWGFYSESRTVAPAMEEIQEMIHRIDFRRIEIEENRIRIGKDQEITTGGFLKGYAVDCVLGLMRKKGMKDGIINAGGSSIGCLTDQGHPVWGIVVNDPVNGRSAGMIRLSSGCCSTSSTLSQQVLFPEGVYGHILNRKTGNPVDNLQCGVLTPDGLSGDILSTVLLQVTPDKFFPALEKLAEVMPVEGYLLTGDHVLVVSDEMVGAFNL